MKHLIIALLSLLSFSSFAQDNKYPRTINVNGTAEMEITPDEIYVQIELREYDKKGSGKIDIQSIRNNFLTAVKSMGIADTNVTIQAYSGWDGNIWYYKKNKKQNPDMKAGITYWVKLNSTAKMDVLVNKLDDEATQNFFIAKVSHSKIQEFRKQLKIQAVKAAREKAIYLAEAINEKVGEAITINEPNELSFHGNPIYRTSNTSMMEQKMGGDDAAPMNVDFKKIKLQFDVNVVFALK
jgi:uncharacterized protein YggE